MYEVLLATIVERALSYGESLQEPCSSECLGKLQARAKSELGSDIPEQYIHFLQKTNGLDWNGLVVYAAERVPIAGYTDRFIEGFVEGNLDNREFEPLKEYLIFADDGVALFTYHVKEDRYEVILSVGLSVLESFASFDELLANALSGHV